jgi:hypothetical protein
MQNGLSCFMCCQDDQLLRAVGRAKVRELQSYCFVSLAEKTSGLGRVALPGVVVVVKFDSGNARQRLGWRDILPKLPAKPADGQNSCDEGDGRSYAGHGRLAVVVPSGRKLNVHLT